MADVYSLAASLSAGLHRAVLAVDVFDSDVVRYVVYQQGTPVHRYVSDQAMTVEMFEDDDGEFKPMIDNVVYPADHVLPEGPRGGDAEAFVPFAMKPANLDRIGSVAPHLMAERQHRDFIAALGLPPASLTAGYRHVDPADFPGAVVVT